MLTILRCGPATTVQDLGRPGLAALGVPRSGAADRGALRLANRLLGNPESAAAFEVTLGGLVVRAERGLWLSVTGAPGPVLVDGSDVGSSHAFTVGPGGLVEVGMPRAGLRTYLAVRGGLAVPPLLGSASADLLSGLVPGPVVEGAGFPVGMPRGGLPPVTEAPVLPLPSVPALRIAPGPRRDWLTAAALSVLTSVEFTVSAESNRVGVRLTGPVLERAVGPGRPAELPSEGLVPGAVQVPPSGQPVIFLADVPTTGGYPVVAVVRPSDLDRVGQLVPGQSVRLTWTG